MFIEALFTITKAWKQLKCPSTEEWIKKMWYVYTMEYFLIIRNNEIMAFAAKWIDRESVILSEVSHRKNIVLNLKRNDTNEFIYKQKDTDLENKLMVAEGKR